jgi:hypothetical protein
MNAKATIQLQIGAAQTRLTVTAADTPAREHVLPLGWQTLFTQRDSLGVPTPFAIEQAIQVVEDALEAVQRQLPVGANFAIDAESVVRLGWAADAQARIDLATVEVWYQALAARSVGAPSARHSSFSDPAGDGIALILREAMHHLGFSELHIGS